ncbi:MAG: surface lipoprotein assembly modifier [Luteimonas sp.]
MRRILEQRSLGRSAERERELLREEGDAGRPTITIDGRSYTVEHTANDVGRALYLSLQNRQWDAAQRFLDEYLTLQDRDPMLVHYAQGVLARVHGRYREAEREIRSLLALKPDFLLGRLELARILFEDQQDRGADALFAGIQASIDADDPRTDGVLRTIDSFRQALAARRAWSGSFALGPAWSDNVNRTSASNTCLLELDDTCFYVRRTPAAIVSPGIDFDASLNKRLPLRGHHGLYLRGLLFGQSWRDNGVYNELNALVQAGYSFRSGRHQIALAPSFDYGALGNSALFGAWGVHAEWSWMPSARSLLKLEADWKDQRYRHPVYADNFDGPLRSAYLTYFRSLGQRWTVFGGVDVVDNATPFEVNDHLQKGARLGATLQWPEGVSSTLFASYRRRGHGAYSPVFETRRKDDEQSYTLVVKLSRWRFVGLTPLLTLRHNRIRSSVDWLYSYDKGLVSLKLERTF